jgi:PAS domain S-box-containing protein
MAGGRLARERLVLVVARDPAVVQLVASALGSAGFAVRLTSDRAEALRLARSLQPGLILLDLDDIDGDVASVTHDLRMAVLWAPIVALGCQPETRDRLAELDLATLLVKPLQASEVVAAVSLFGWDLDTGLREGHLLRDWLGAIANSSQDAIIGIGPSGTIASWNAGAERLYGYTAEEAIGQSIYATVPPDRAHELIEVSKRIHRGESIAPYETVRRHKDGRDLHVSLSITPFYDDQGNTLGSVIVGRDVSERARAYQERERLLAREQAARAEAASAQRRLTFLAEASRELAASLDYELTLERVAHLAVPTIADACVVGIVDGDSLENVAVAVANPAFASVVRELVARRSTRFGDDTGIARLLRAGEAVLIEEVRAEHLRSYVLNEAAHPFLLHVLKSAILVPLRARDRTLGVIGLTVGVSGRQFSRDDFELAKALATRAGLAIDNARLYAAERAARQEAEASQAELEISQARLRAIFEHSLDAILLADDQGCFLEANPAAGELTGYSRADLLTLSLRDLSLPNPNVASDDLWQAVRREGQQRGELTIRRSDGETCLVEYTAVMNIAPGLHLAILRDVTAHRRVEERQRQAQKLEAIGQLAGGVAHDFNNLLTVITGYAELLASRADPTSPDRDSIAQILAASQSAAALTSQLLAFSRRQVTAPKEIDVNDLIERMGRLIRRLVGEDIVVVLDLAPDAGAVTIDPGQLEQVLLNLAANARDAMPRGGRLEISSRRLEQAEAERRLHPDARPGSYVVIQASDTGVGMDADTAAHIFEPFFTTKEAGKGTGLGLAAVYGIVTQSGGWVEVQSEPAQGSIFSVYLPRSERPAEPSPVSPGANRLPTGNETILLVEDEDQVRGLTRRTLELCGYHVLGASSGREALAVADGYPGPIHLLLTDVVMDGLSGREVAERIAERRPAIKVVYFSGYTDDAIVRHGVSEALVAFLPKPFTSLALAQKVRAVLDEAKADQ